MAIVYDLLVVKHDQATADEQRDLIAETGYWMLAGLKLKDYFKKITSGMQPGAVQSKTNLAYATGLITLSNLVATDTITVNGIVYTCVASGATGAFQFNVGASDTAAAANFAIALNADTSNNTMCSATSSAAVITIQAYLPGAIGNAITTAISAHGTAANARCINGTNGDQERTHYYGSTNPTF